MLPKFLENGTPMKFATGDMIFDENQALEKTPIYFVLEGEVEIIKRYAPMKTDKFKVKKGNLFGLLEVYAQSNRVTQAKVLSKSQIIAFKVNDFEEGMRAHLNLAILAIKNLSSILRDINNRVKELK